MENLGRELKELPARRGFSIVYCGKTLLSRFDPVAQGERLAADFPMEERTLYFCPSPLYGYGLSLLLEKLPPDSAVLCAEADEKLFEISKKSLNDYLSLPSGGRGNNAAPLALVPASDPETICAFVQKTWGSRTFRRVKTLRLSGGWQLFPALYDNIETALRRELAVEWGNAMTMIRLGRLYAKNLIRNLALIPKSERISALDFSSSPQLVLGAGPSIDPFLEELSGFWKKEKTTPERRRFRIVCVDTCLPCLIERGIIPDLVVILESQHWNLGDFTGFNGMDIDTAIDLSALPASAAVLGGKRYLYATPWTRLALFSRLKEEGLLAETFEPMCSVGLTAVAVALRAGSGPVFTTGIDFSFTADAYHARSTPGHSALTRRSNRLRSIINAAAAFRDGSFSTLSKTGKSVRSDPAMRNYRNLFEQEFGGNERLYDIAGSGLPLGVKTVSPAEALALLNGAELSVSNRTSGDVSRVLHLREKIIGFVRLEMESLETLRQMLTGAAAAETARLEELLDRADYLWAHFPECAGAGGRRPPASELSFLKRVRIEIEPFLKLWEMTLRELE